MLQLFPGNYGWSLCALRVLVSGGDFGDIYFVCKDLVEASKTRDNNAWHIGWKRLAEEVDALAEERLKSKHLITATNAFYRASLYYQWAEAFLPPSDPRAKPMYDKHLSTFARFAELSSPRIEIIDIPFDGTNLKAYFVPPHNGAKPAPCTIVAGGFDGNKEETYPLAKAMASRGIASLGIDFPGQGATLRNSGLPARFDTEKPVAAAIDYLATRSDIDINRIGIAATSAGGYYAPRAAAFEKRIKACVPWSAVYDYYAIWKRRLAFENGKPTGLRPEIPFPVTPELVLSIMGVDNWEAALSRWESFRLQGVAEKIECDLLVVQGEDDPQTPLWEAEQLYKEARSKHKELRVYRHSEGGSAHVQVDRQEPAMNFIADWMADRLQAI